MVDEPITIIEIDLDFCDLTFGTSPCTAALSGSVPKKCFNTFYTCKDQQNYSKGSLTYRFIEPTSSYPKIGTVFPCLKSVSGSSAMANIAGADSKLYGLGKRATVTATFSDFPYGDKFMDNYQSERISGAAQFSAVGYIPKEYGTFWSKLKARNPNYAGRPMRKITGVIRDGALIIEKTRHFIITEIKGPGTNGIVTIEGKDILKLADDDRALAPSPSRGKISADIADSGTPSFDLLPSGIGDEYPASGFAAVGSELMSYTRSGDTITITERALSGTQISSHSINDTFQDSFSIRNQQIHVTIRDLLRDYAGVDPSFIPFSDWADEVGIWAPSLVLTADIMKPEGVSKLIGELAVLGVTIWWDEVAQEIKLKINAPVDLQSIVSLTDRNNIIAASEEDRAEDRLTEVLFNTVQIDPSKGVNEDNFLRGDLFVSTLEKTDNAFGDTKVKTINCRWVNHGDYASIRILALRLLARFKLAPWRYVIDVDYRDDLGIADVVSLNSYIATDDTGELQPQLAQVIMREDKVEGSTVTLRLQKFQFDQRYGYITENTRPLYTASIDAQKDRGAYFVNGTTLLFGDGTGPYLFI